MEEVCVQKWFWGATSRESAFAALCSHNNGTFLVRINNGKNVPISQSPFTITWKDKDGNLQDMRVWIREGRKGLMVEHQKSFISVRTDSLSIIELIAKLQALYSASFSPPPTSPIYSYLESALVMKYEIEKPQESTVPHT